MKRTPLIRRTPLRRKRPMKQWRRPEEKTCPNCQRPFIPKESKQKSCSLSCGVTAYHALQRKQRTRRCQGCQKEFHPYPSTIQRSSAKWCSMACYVAFRSKRPAFIEVKCAECGTQFHRTKAAIDRVKSGNAYCSRVCATKSHTGPRGETHPHWRGGTRLYRGVLWRRLAEEIRERDKRQCRRCGKQESEQKRRLSVDHIRPFREFATLEEANDRANLVSLCDSCHSTKTSTVERLYWKQGDILGMRRFEESINLPSATE